MAKKTSTNGKKRISCTYCAQAIEVSPRAMSIFCPHCHKRVVCEDYTIRSYHAVRNLATCGSVIVERKGHVVAPIRADKLIIRGLVRGNIRALSLVEVESTGVVQGNVEAPRLIIHAGARLMGVYKITRNGSRKEPGPAGRKPAQAPERTRPAPTRKAPSGSTPATHVEA